MKPLLICLLLIIYTNIVRGQNFIYNGDFEICKSGNPACGSVPDNNNYCGSGCRELQYVDGDWFDVKRGIHGTVDWWKGPYFCYAWTAASTAANSPNDCLSGQYAESGSNFIGLFDGEGAEYKFPSSLPVGVYKVSFWVKGNYYNMDPDWGVGPNGTYGVSVSVNDTKMELSRSYCDLDRGFEIFNTQFPASDYDTWHQVTCFIETRTQTVNYIVFGGLWGRSCTDKHSYVFIDNITIEKTCCATEMRYQNTSENPNLSILPRLTQRTDLIIAGSNVSNYPQLMTGSVIVKTDSVVRFEAAHRVLMVPGFSVEPGGVYRGSIGDCQRENETSEDYGISLISYSGENGGIFWMWCDNTDLFHCLGFLSKGATHYRVRMLNSSSEKFYDAEGEISETWTPYFCGNGASGESPLSGPVEVILELYNCANYTYYDHQINIEYNTNIGCAPANKTDITPAFGDTLVQASYNNSQQILIFPNPASDILHIKATSDLKIECVNIFDNIGQLVVSSNNPSGSNLININIEGIVPGMYICKTKTIDQFFTQKINIKNIQ